MNVCGYVRVSSDGQTENYSIPQQQKAIRSYCKAKEWDLVKMYVDGGYTGANINRPALQELIEIFEKNGTKFASISENFDTSTPLGMAMIGILSTFAQLAPLI